MDINDLRSIITVFSLVLFMALVAWTCQGARRADFDEAARLPFADKDADEDAEEGRS